MSGTSEDELRELLAGGGREEARRRLEEAREAREDAPDPEALGAERIGGVPEAAEEEGSVLEAWALPEELGGGALFADRRIRPPHVTLVAPEDLLVLSFGGIGAAVGSVPVDVHRRSPDGEVEVVSAWTVEVGPGSAGEPYGDGPTPEELLEETRRLLEAVEAATGCGWVRSGDLPKEEWERETFLEHYGELAREWGAEPMDGETVDRQNFWIRYTSSIGHETVEGFARAVFRSAEAPRIDDAVLEDAAETLAWSIGEETGIRPDGLTVAVDGPRLEAWLDGETLAELRCTRAEGEELAAEGPDRVAEALFTRLPDGLADRLVEIERERLSARLAGAVEERVRSGLAGDGSAAEGELDVSVEVVELPRPGRHGDPEEAGGRGHPPFGVSVRSWDPDAEVVVEIDVEPPDVERLAREAVDGLREALEGGGEEADRDGSGSHAGAEDEPEAGP